MNTKPTIEEQAVLRHLSQRFQAVQYEYQRAQNELSAYGNQVTQRLGLTDGQYNFNMETMEITKRPEENGVVPFPNRRARRTVAKPKSGERNGNEVKESQEKTAQEGVAR